MTYRPSAYQTIQQAVDEHPEQGGAALLVEVAGETGGCIETEASVAYAERVSAQAGADYGGGKHAIMEWLGGIQMGRPTRPKEVAEMTVILALPGSALVAGAEYRIDGGTVPSVD